MSTTSFRAPAKRSPASMPEYQRQNFATPGADASARLSDSAAGIYERGADQTGRQLMALGGAMQQAAKVGDALYVDYQTTKAREAFNNYRREAMQKKAELANLQGGLALDEKTGVQARLSQWQSEARERLVKDLGKPAANLFTAAAEDVDAQLGAWATQKWQSEERTYRSQQMEATIALNMDEMLTNPMNAEAVKQGFKAIKSGYKELADLNGWSDEYAQSQINSAAQKAFTTMIRAQIDSEQLGNAQELVGRYGHALGGMRGPLEATLKAKGRELEARARATQERADTVQAANLGAGLFETYGDDAAKVQSVLEEKVKDPVQRARVTQSYLSNASLHERMKTQTEERDKAASYDNAISQTDSILAGQESEQKKAALLSGVLVGVADPATRKKIEEYQDFKINGTEAPVDKNVLAEAQVYAAQPGVRPDMVTNHYADKLPPSALGKAVKIARDEATKQSEKLMQDEITESLVDDFGYTRSQATAGYRVILSRMTGLVDPAQRLERARMLAREISVKNDAWFSSSGWGSGVKIPAYDFQQTIVEDSAFNFVEIPEKDIPQVDQWLRVRGLPLTEKNRRAAYTQFLKAKNADAQGAEN